MDFLPKPRDFKVNPNDDKLILNLPDDPEPRVELKAKGKNIYIFLFKCKQSWHCNHFSGSWFITQFKTTLVF